jgi:signal transduction histidine kinase
VGRAKGSPSFEESSVELLSILSNQGAAFLENARLVRELEDWNQELEERVDERTEELRKAQDRLVRAERLAAIGELGASVAHELRNPLGVISNSMYYLKTRLGDQDGKVVKHLDIIGREVKTANRIITDLMNFVRSKNLKVDSVDPGALLRHSLERARIPEDVDVHMDVNGDLPTIEADGDKAGQVFLNLLDNAVEAMPQGGDLYIDAEAGKDGVVFTFEDTGVGIPPENAEKVFEPLFTTKTKGIGLGLSIVKLLVEAHGGDVCVQSEEGQGAHFTVRLPYQEEKVGS